MINETAAGKNVSKTLDSDWSEGVDSSPIAAAGTGVPAAIQMTG